MVEGVRVFIDIVTMTYEHEYELWISVENQIRFNDLLREEKLSNRGAHVHASHSDSIGAHQV